MIKVNIHDMFSMDGRIVYNSDFNTVRETKKLNNICLYSGILFKDKHTNPIKYKNHDAVYLIVDGRASIESEDEIIKCHRHDIIFISNNMQHIIVNTGDVHFKYLIMKEKV
jgi:mannose-6-phosphate isomerase-like protein (cupin superfamily)